MHSRHVALQCGCFVSNMENSPKLDVELYGEIVGDPNHSTMNSSPSSSTHDVRELPPSQEPMPYSGNEETSLATTPRSALRPQLAGYPEEPRTVAVIYIWRVRSLILHNI